MIATEIVTVTQFVTVTRYYEDLLSPETPAAPAGTSVADSEGRREGYAPKQSVAPPPPAEAPVTMATQVRPAPQPTPEVVAPPPAPAAPPAPPAPVVNLGGKRGLAYNDPSLLPLFVGGGSKCTWAYNWGSWYDISIDVPFVPMLWGLRREFVSVWKQNAENAIRRGSTHFLSFNEPDLGSQANIPDIGTAVAGHIEHMLEFSNRGIKIGAPAVTNSGARNQGASYLRQFMAACDANPDCRVDFCPYHWYDSAQNTKGFIEQAHIIHEICGGREVWITEFAAYGSDAEVDAFLKTVLPQLDALPFVARYSYFMVAQGRLVQGNSLSSYGRTYALS